MNKVKSSSAAFTEPKKPNAHEADDAAKLYIPVRLPLCPLCPSFSHSAVPQQRQSTTPVHNQLQESPQLEGATGSAVQLEALLLLLCSAAVE
jgi:hypothetical protein